MSPRQAWRAIQAGLPREAIISSDIGNNCAIGNAYPSFDGGAQISRAGAVRPVRLRLPRHRRSEDRQPGHALRRLRRRRRLRHLDERNELDRPRRLARRDDGRVPQLPMGAEKRNSILWYDDNFVGTELNPNLSYAKVATSVRVRGRRRDDAGRTDRSDPQVVRRPEARRHHFHRSGAQPGARRAVPPRRDEEAGRRRRRRPRRHAGADDRLNGSSGRRERPLSAVERRRSRTLRTKALRSRRIAASPRPLTSAEAFQ